MKTNKLLLGAALLALSMLFASCGDKPAAKPEVVKIDAYDFDDHKVSFENGDLHIDPTKLSYIDIRFDKPMDKEGMGFIYYYGKKPTDYKWLNSYAFRITFMLNYDEEIKIVLNDNSYNYEQEGISEKEYFFRDTEGNFLDEYPIEFKTIKNPRIENKTFEFNLNECSEDEYLVDLVYNLYGENLQNKFSIKNLFLPDTLKVGDVIKLKYTIKSNYDLPKIMVNLVDPNEAYNYWGLIAEEKDVPLANENEKIKADVEYTNEITFHITKNMIEECNIVFTCEDCDPENPENPVQFLILKNSSTL